MDYQAMLIALGIDCIAFAFHLRKYFTSSNSVKAVKGADLHEVGNDLIDLVDKTPSNKIDYVAIRGEVKPVGECIRSVNDEDVKGVVQKLRVKEHFAVKGNACHNWSDRTDTLKLESNSVPFVITNGQSQIEVCSPMVADTLDLETISDVFKPSSNNHRRSYESGTGSRVQKGLQYTEEMLKEGSIVIGIGQLTRAPTEATLILRPPTDGSPYCLTTMTIDELVTKLDSERKGHRFACIILGVVGLTVGGFLLRRYLRRKARAEEQRRENESKEASRNARKERRRRVREKEVREEQVCVVCRSNPREIILLPCGHVCLCEDCNEDVTSKCPICRSEILHRNVAYNA